MIKKYTARIFFKKINLRIAEIRIEKGLTQKTTSENIGVDLRDYQRWESDRTLTLWSLYRLSIVFDCPVSDFFQSPNFRKRGPGRPKKFSIKLNQTPK